MSTMIKIEHKILSHPWYRKWECGELAVESLRTYAQEYYWQVANFPRYLSRLHSQLDDLQDRQVVLANLAEEEDMNAPHPELWLDFAESLGLNRNEVKARTAGPAAQKLVETFRGLVASGRPEALGTILAYESQVPEVAKFKSQALKEHYLQADQAAKGSEFFRVHALADEWHTAALDGVVAKLPAHEKKQAQAAADEASLALWSFLDAMPN